MKIISNKTTILTSVLMLSTISPVSYAENMQVPGTIPIQHEGRATYVTGGIGDEERDMLDSVRHEYNLHIMNSSKQGEFMDNTKIKIYDTAGNEVLSTSAGPLLFANLPAGKYALTAENGGNTKRKNVIISSTHETNTNLVWN